jgi:hypothetical protein
VSRWRRPGRRTRPPHRPAGGRPSSRRTTSGPAGTRCPSRQTHVGRPSAQLTDEPSTMKAPSTMAPPRATVMSRRRERTLARRPRTVAWVMRRRPGRRAWSARSNRVGWRPSQAARGTHA